MSYQRLMRDHVAIDAMREELLDLVRGPARPEEAAGLMRRLAVAVRDHHIAEQAALAATVGAAAHDRHAAAAVTAMTDVTRQMEEWTAFVYRWTPEAIGAEWERFVPAAEAMAAVMQARFDFETSVLYSLAVYYGLLGPVD